MSVVLTYNNVTLKHTKTRWRAEAIYSDNGEEYMYTKIVIDVQGYANQTLTGMTNTTYLQYIRQQFAQQKKPLTLTIDGNKYLDLPNGDAQTGPKVTNITTIDMVDGKTILFGCTIECCIVDCDSPGAKAPAVLSNRWTQSQDIDDEGYSKITSEGKLIVNRTANLNADRFREIIVPVKTVPNGFVRTSERYTLSSDGLSLTWTVTDSEHYRPPTNNITKWEGTWTEESSYSNGSGAIITGTIDVYAIGQKNLPKAKLVEFCVKVAMSRINFKGVSSGGDIIRSYRLQESLSHNKVTLSIVVITISEKDLKQMKVTTRVGQPVIPLDTDPKTWRNVRGTYLTNLFVAEILGPCDDKTKGIAPYTTQVGVYPDPKGKEYQQDYTKTTTDSASKYTAEHYKSPYIDYKIQAETSTDEHILGGLPVASSSTTKAMFVRVAKPTTIREIRFTGERLGKSPLAPDPAIDDNHVLIHSSIVLNEPELMPDGQNKIFRIHGVYRYGLRDAVAIGTDSIKLPKAPLDNTEGSELTKSDYTKIFSGSTSEAK